MKRNPTQTQGSSRRDVLKMGGAAALSSTFLSPSALFAEAPMGDLMPFDPSAPGGMAPTDLPARIGAVHSASVGLFQTIDASIRKGAEDFGIEYVSAFGDGTAESVVEQGDIILNRGVGLMYGFVTNPEAEEPMLRRALDAGVNVAYVAGFPCTMQMNGSQAAAGTRQAQVAIEWIKENLGDDAKVAYLNNAKTPFLVPRDEAVRATFAAAGIELVADETPQEATAEGGFTTVSTLLQRNPGLNVVLGPFNVMAGAVSAMEAAGKTGDDIYMSVGNPTEAEMDLIAEGGILRAGLVFPFEPMCYALAPLTQDWLAGKTVPMGITVPGGNVVIEGAEGVAQYREDISDLNALYNSDRFGIYVGYWGNTSYEERTKNVWGHSWQQENV